MQIAGRVWAKASARDAIAGAMIIPFAACTLIRLAGLGRPWLLVTAMALTPYAAALALVPVVTALVLRRWLVAGVAVLVAAMLAGCVLPAHLAGRTGPTADRCCGY